MSTPRAPAAPIRYRVQAADLLRHRWTVELRIARPQERQTVSLPVWIPGSYLVREFSRHLNHLRANQGEQDCPIEQVDKCSWTVQADPRRPLVLRYEVLALDNSVRAAWLDADRGFFNGTSLLLRVHGQEDQPHQLSLPRPRARAAAQWQLATAMTALRVDARGFGDYQAGDYDELVDHPVEMGQFWSGEFKVRGVPHRFVVAGAPPGFDGERLLRDTQKICEAAIALWHPRGKPPHRHYLFMLNAVADGYGGLEHRNSTALICRRADLPRQGAPADAAAVGDDYIGLLGLISHEYFHTWNVKRLKPAEFAPYDFSQENYTRLLWFFEGFTSYYDDLLLRRAGLIDDAAYLKLLARTINQVQQTPGRQVQSVAQASHDAWIRYYRPDAHTPNTTVSYYTKGALVALCFDLSLRAHGHTLDELMRLLWQRCRGGPLQEADVLTGLQELAGRSFEAELAAWVHGTDELPLEALLQSQGITVRHEPAVPEQALGLRLDQSQGIRVRMVLDGGAASAAGMAPGDEWLGIELPADADSKRAAEGWRLRKLDELALYAGPATRLTALVARDQRLLRLPLQLPRDITSWALLPAPARDGNAEAAWPGR